MPDRKDYYRKYRASCSNNCKDCGSFLEKKRARCVECRVKRSINFREKKCASCNIRVWSRSTWCRTCSGVQKRRSEAEKMAMRLRIALRSRLRKAVKTSGRGKTLKEFGFSKEELVEHLESRFQDGMDWSNYGPKGWHIDHIRPLISFDLSKPEQVREATNLENLQPLWWFQNLSKKARTDWVFSPHYHMYLCETCGESKEHKNHA